MTLPYGFHIVGSTWEQRRLVDAGAAFTGYCSCDERARIECEAYLAPSVSAMTSRPERIASVL